MCDQYIMVMDDSPEEEVSFKIPKAAKEMWYWRQNYKLEMFMRKVYRSKGGRIADINKFMSVKLCYADFTKLHSCIQNRQVDINDSFFLDASNNETPNFFSNVLKLLKSGKNLLYVST